MGCRLLTHGTGPGCLHFECRGAPARVPGVEMRGSPPLLPHHFVCVEPTFTLPYLTLAPLVYGYGSDSTLDEWLPWLRRGAM